MNTKDTTDTGHIRQLYNRYLRKDLSESGFRREEAPPVIRYVNERGSHSLILHFELDGLPNEEIDRIADREIEYFRKLGHSFEWKVFDYDRPPDLRHLLDGRGYTVETEEAVMILDISHMPERLKIDVGPRTRRHRPCMPGGSLAPRQVTDPTKLPEILSAVQNNAFKSTFDTLRSPDSAPPSPHPLEEELMTRMSEDSDSMAFYVITDQGKPVAAAWSLYFGDAPIAGLYGGATVPEYRRRGLYTALVSARARAARDRGIQYLTVDAGAMSEPILKHIGFQKLATTWPVSYSPEALS